MRDEELGWRIDRFFRWFSGRLANAESLSGLHAADSASPQSYEPEQHVLIGAGLDALAKYWASAFSPGLTKASPRMQAFLVENANSTGIWGRVAAPMLRSNAAKRHQTDWVDAVSRAAGAGRSITRSYKDDPFRDDLLAHPDIANSGIPPEVVDRYLYGRLLYKEYRCAWVHDFEASDELSSPGGGAAVPRYQALTVFAGELENGQHRLRLVFPLSFLLSTYREAIASFEARCVRENTDPCGDADGEAQSVQ